MSGLWHGAAWTFIIWGALHALYLSLERVTNWPRHLKKIPGGLVLSVLLTNILVLVGWVFFRAESAGDAVLIINNMFSFNNEGAFMMSDVIRNGLFWLLMSLLIEILSYFRIKPHGYFPRKYARIADMVYVAGMCLACLYLRGDGNVFIYFQF